MSAESVGGTPMSAAGPPQGANWPCRPRRCETQRLLVPSMPAQAGMEPRHSAPSGGRIVSTVRATRSASEADLLRASEPRLVRLLAEGVSTVEIKSGYGLDLANELKMLRVARGLCAAHGVDVQTTLLAAHAIPPEYAGRVDDYIALVCDEIIPAAVGERLADAMDAYCESIAFSPAQVRRVF